MNRQLDRHDALPWVYELRLLNGRLLVIDFNRGAWDWMAGKMAGAPGADHRAEELKLNCGFDVPEILEAADGRTLPAGPVGYLGMLTPRCADEHTVSFQLDLRRLVCEDTNAPRLAASATLGFLFMTASVVAYDVVDFSGELQPGARRLTVHAPTRRQLMHVELCTIQDMGGMAISVTLAPAVVGQLDVFLSQEKSASWVHDAIKTAAHESWKAMHPPTDYWVADPNAMRFSRFGLMYNGPPGRLHFNCPGNACGLDVDYHYEEPGKIIGRELNPHNVDSVTQQMNLLCQAVAATTLARKAGAGKCAPWPDGGGGGAESIPPRIVPVGKIPIVRDYIIVDDPRGPDAQTPEQADATRRWWDETVAQSKVEKKEQGNQ